MEDTYEGMLFTYGITCLENRLYRGKIRKEDYDKAMDYWNKGKTPSSEFISKILPFADEKITEKTPEAVERYFLEQHNSIIDKKEGEYANMPDILCESCKVLIGDVVKIENFKEIPYPVYRIKYKSHEDIAVGKFFRDVKVGDRVITHNKAIVKKIKK
ncbi:MAG: hypothetical protein QXW97_01530 [Candidatus Pacearchaeota archaeon]